MPVVATSARPTVRQVTELIRSLLNDVDFPFAQSNIQAPAVGAVRASNVVTILTLANHSLTPGHRVMIQGVVDASFDGTYTVDTVPSPNTFTYAQTGPNGSSGNGLVTLLNPGDVFTNEILLPFVQLAYRKVQRRLGVSSAKTMRATFQFTLPANTTLLTDTGVPAIPSDLISPFSLEEKQSGGALGWVPVKKVDRLPDIQPGGVLAVYVWEGEEFLFLGATEDREIRLRYYKALDDPLGPDSQLFIRGCLDPVAHYAGYIAAASKGGDAIHLRGEYQESVSELISLDVKQRQRKPFRRRPYGGRRRW